MVLWVDEHRPRGLNNLDLHPDITNKLRKLAATGDIPHMLVFGPPGSGKRTRINALLKEIFGPSVEKVRVTQRSVETRSKTIEIPSLTSTYHIEINPSDAGNADTFVVQEVIKEIAMTQSVSVVSRAVPTNTSSEMADDSARVVPSFKVVVLHEVDKLSTDAQHGLRRTMEQYTGSCRLILCAESACRVTAPLKSRCLLVRVPAPSPIEITNVLNKVARSERLNLPPVLAQNICQASQGSLRRALLALECTAVCAGGQLQNNTEVKLPEWELFTQDIVRNIQEEQSPGRLLLVRAQLYQLLANCIPADIILQEIARGLCASGSDMLQHQVVRWRAFYDHRLATGTKPIFHLEAFVAKIMAVIKAMNASRM